MTPSGQPQASANRPGDVTYVCSTRAGITFNEQIIRPGPWTKLHRKEKTAKTGEVDGMALATASYAARPGTVDDGYRVAPLFSRRTYSCVRLKLPWEVSEETFTDNIEGERLEDKLMGMLTTQLGLDLEDLHWNGDTADVSPDADFLSVNDGWWKQLTAGAHVVNGAAINGGVISKEHFFAAYRALPHKYFRSGRVVWAMNPATKISWWRPCLTGPPGPGTWPFWSRRGQQAHGFDIVDVPPG
jgi:hypothetical protein